ncbi:murein biosynthesis integral membrane protein MurJ [Neptunicella marina]|uniref:Probable lipid II flippase MurJ n=1 Tax=Neptunicella marina TaxID=2125989 RepID=A0A8J6ITB6_9ALTE|nr:murein biosynthesis integral membrane protein MurJ [Neptunicella marina]MBC3765435.1 murein biosynthesis integral membrane protein MurJ [Neptunicella marina]
MSGKLLKSGMIVSAMTFVSRVMGLARDVIVANLLGAGGSADVFLLANKIPNFLRRLFAEGAFAQAFIPMLSEVKHQHSEDELKLFIARVAGTLGTLVMIVTILGVIASPILAMLFANGWFIDYLNGGPEAAKYELAALMLKITFPYLFFITLTALSGAILNTLNRFAVSAFTPVLLNACIIGAALWLSPQLTEPAIGLAWGVFIGGVVQFVFQIPFLRKAGLLVKPQWGWRDPQVSRVRKLMIPALFGVSVSQINLLFDTFIASHLQDSSISWLYYSDRLLEFPLGLFGIAIATVILPTLSNDHAKQDHQAFKQNMDWGLKMVCLLGIPATAGLIVLASPMLTVLFQRGEFTANDVVMTSAALVAYASGLLCFMLIKVLAPGFYSRQDVKTPVKFGIWAMISNMVFNVIFAWHFSYVGLAMATSASALLNAILLYQQLHRSQIFRVSRKTIIFVSQILLAALVMAGCLHWWQPSNQQWMAWDIKQQILALSACIAGACVIFVTSAIVLGVRPSSLLRKTADL